MEKLDRNGHADLPHGHPGYGLVTRRQFDRRRYQDLIPRPVRQTRRQHGYGSEVEYPSGTREQLQALMGLERRRLRGPALLRLALWMEGYAVPDHRLERDIQSVLVGLGAARSELRKQNSDLAADDVVRTMVASHKPSLAIRLARSRLPKRDDLESALLILVQIFSGTSPQDLELDRDTSRLFAALIEAFASGVSVDPATVHDMFVRDEQFGPYLAGLSNLESASLQDWKQARDDAILLRKGGVFPPLEGSLGGSQWFAMNFGLVLSALSARRLDRANWEEILSTIRAATTVVAPDSTSQSVPRGGEDNGAQPKDR